MPGTPRQASKKPTRTVFSCGTTRTWQTLDPSLHCVPPSSLATSPRACKLGCFGSRMKPQKRARKIANRSSSTVLGNEIMSVSIYDFGRSGLWEKAKSVNCERFNDDVHILVMV